MGNCWQVGTGHSHGAPILSGLYLVTPPAPPILSEASQPWQDEQTDVEAQYLGHTAPDGARAAKKR